MTNAKYIREYNYKGQKVVLACASYLTPQLISNDAPVPFTWNAADSLTEHRINEQVLTCIQIFEIVVEQENMIRITIPCVQS